MKAGGHRWMRVGLLTGLAWFTNLSGSQAQSGQPAGTAVTVPTPAYSQAQADAERERAIQAARELREAKERAAMQVPVNQSYLSRNQVSDMRDLSRTIHVDPYEVAAQREAMRSQAAEAAAAEAAGSGKGRARFGGLFGKKKKEPTSGVVADNPEVQALGEQPLPEAPVAPSAPSTDRIPPPMLDGPVIPEPYLGPGEFSDPVPFSEVAPAPSTAIGGYESPQPESRASEEKGLFGGLFSRKGGGDLESATMASADDGERKGFFGRLLGGREKAPAGPAIPPPSIPPAEIPISSEAGGIDHPSPPTHAQPGAPDLSAQEFSAGPQRDLDNLPMSRRLSAQGISVAPQTVPPTQAPVSAGSPSPPASSEGSATVGAHFVVVQDNGGAKFVNSNGESQQTLAAGTVMQLRQIQGNHSFVRLTSGLEGFVETRVLRDANFEEATMFYRGGGAVAE